MRAPSLSDAEDELFRTMLQVLDRIALYIRGVDLRTFTDDQRTIDAVALNFLVVGECARRRSAQASLVPAGPWPEMAALRRRIAHGYAGVEPTVLWGVATYDAADLRPRIAALLGAG